MLRKLLSLMMIAVLPGALLAADSAGAMLYAKGTAWLNGSTVPRSSAVFPGEVKVEPVSDSWTEYDVTEKDGTVQIVARKGDVSVSDETGTSTRSQGQQTTREQPSEKNQKKKKGGAIPAAGGSILDSKAVLYGGIGAAGVLTGLILSQGDEPVSPAKP